MGLLGELASWVLQKRERRDEKKWPERHNEGNGIEKYSTVAGRWKKNVNGIIMLIFGWILFVRNKVKEIEQEKWC